MRLGLYRLFLSCLLFCSAIKREASFTVTVNKTIRGRSSRVLGKISFQGSAYQRSWKVWKDCESPPHTRRYLPPTFIPQWLPVSHRSRITVANLTLALHPCHKINKSIIFPHTCAPCITTRLKIVSSHIPVSLLNIPPSMAKLLGSTRVTIVNQCCGSETYRDGNAMCLNVGNKKLPHLINPLLSGRLSELWVFYTKQTWQTTWRNTPYESDAVILGLCLPCMQQVKPISKDLMRLCFEYVDI